MIFFLCLSLVLTTLVGCDESTSTMSTKDNTENTVNYLITNGGQVILPLTNFNTLNPLMTENTYYHYFSKLIFEGLFEFDNRLEPQPRLAQSYSINDDGTNLNIKLRDDVYWHDGEKFTARDVAFTINTLKFANKENAYSKAAPNVFGSYSSDEIKEIKDVKIIDEQNLTITFNQGGSNILELLTFPIVPYHAFGNQSKGANYSKALEIENYTPIGTGPYRFVNYNKHKSVHLQSFENYRFGQPEIREIVGKVLEDEELILTSFETGQLNIATALDVDWDKYRNNNRIKVIEYITNNYDFLGFNFTNQIFSGEKGSAIRKAINYGIDRQGIIQKIYLGHGSQIDVPIFPESWLISEEAHTYGYNIDMAKNQLLANGFKDLNDDGILVDDEGNRLSFRLLTNSYNFYKTRVAEKIKEDLKAIGIEIVFDFDISYRENISEEMKTNEIERINKKISSGDFDIVLSSWEMSLIPDLSFIFHSKNQNLNNFIKYNSEDMDLKLENTLNAVNREGKLNSYKELQKIIISDLPYVSLFFNNKALLVDSGIMGELNPTFFNPYNGLEKCFFATKAQ